MLFWTWLCHEGKFSQTGLNSHSAWGLTSLSFIPALTITEPASPSWLGSLTQPAGAGGSTVLSSSPHPQMPRTPPFLSTTLLLSAPSPAAAHGCQAIPLHLPITDWLPTSWSSSSLFAVTKEYNRHGWESSLLMCCNIKDPADGRVVKLFKPT